MAAHFSVMSWLIRRRPSFKSQSLKGPWARISLFDRKYSRREFSHSVIAT
jgi:hypothetical protein